MPHVTALKKLKRTIVNRHAGPNNRSGLVVVATPLLPLAVLWVGVVLGARVSLVLTAGLVALMSLFLLRGFVLMHECGHGSLFLSPRLNRVFGFGFGVLSAMPQYVWSQHHQFHHSTNGNWAKYRGPLHTITVADYAAMSDAEQHRYRRARSI